ncbi:hypothetical protein [Actinomadura rubrisoli]|uniref:Uncharacterized protein n=1 Tax=Actinomadura rubrisoli TaxID=2530368 RepID=A0A4R5CCN0_9ACTN|nr:hypothetical protein [Actinomadura rubrisoli]TDD97215.1 hypothetical protein E1298_01910 [Actinomadura rubrisoli]
MRFYRVARPLAGDWQGIPVGPYQWRSRKDKDGDVLTEMSYEHCDSNHPTPQLDGLGHIDGDEYCGFPSMDELRSWFDGDWLELLGSIGFRIYVYEVDEDYVREGGHQAVAPLHSDYGTALVDEIDLMEMENAGH